MGYLSHRVERRQLKPGDHIYTYRKSFTYSHHGIYRGNGEVVQFNASPSSLASSSSSSSSSPSFSKASAGGPPCSVCSALEYSERRSGVMVSCLDCFLRSTTKRPHLYEYGVSKTAYKFKRRGTSNTAESSPAEVVMDTASSLLENNGFGEYKLLHNNCEDFATFCKTGQPCHRNGTSGRFGQASYLPISGFLAQRANENRGFT